MHRKVAITGLGVVVPHGMEVAAFFDALMHGESALKVHSPNGAPGPVAIPAGRCEYFDAVAALGRARANGMDRYSQIGTAAALSAWNDAGLDFASGIDHDDIGVFWGTGGGGTSTVERGYQDLFLRARPRISPLSVILGMNNAAASHIGMALGLGGANFTYSVACASSAIALGEAFRRVRSGEAPIALAGGSETPLTYGVIRAWESLQVLAPGDEDTAHAVCRPFHSDRRGLVLSEGAGAMVLEDWQHAVARGADIHAELAGFGTSCDHTHLSRPDPTGQVRAMRAAIDDAGLNPADIDYVNAHGTATREEDVAETEALRKVFGKHAPDVAVSATKSMHGHLMGATGIVEAIVTALALRRQSVPPTAFLDTLDPACAGLHHVTRAETGFRIRAALSNSFAFGGSNAVLAFRSA
ncbi:MAG: beta-ketoacyl-[acyl-carrier-protein] synthase family protein [Gallionellaceae bacterium]|nr:beta-ketoacyl-[acyl-carrier-protein] synthase family protein [Gallionellaceae bacterium]